MEGSLFAEARKELNTDKTEHRDMRIGTGIQDKTSLKHFRPDSIDGMADVILTQEMMNGTALYGMGADRANDKYCRQCGEKREANGKFCSNCGAPFG
jgi:hypothetical protein